MVSTYPISPEVNFVSMVKNKVAMFDGMLLLSW